MPLQAVVSPELQSRKPDCVSGLVFLSYDILRNAMGISDMVKMFEIIEEWREYEIYQGFF